MSGDIEVGTCDVCKKENVQLNRKVYYYPIKCECHSTQHFEIVFHCSECKPIEPKQTTIVVMTKDLQKQCVDQSVKEGRKHCNFCSGNSCSEYKLPILLK